MFWWKIGIITLILFLLISVLNLILRNVFKIEKEKKAFFSYNHINDLHKKVDWSVRIASFLVSVAVLYQVIFNDFSVTLFLAILILLTVADYSIRAIFEWKYSQNPKQAILTISEMSVFVIAWIVIIQLDVFNLYIT